MTIDKSPACVLCCFVFCSATVTEGWNYSVLTLLLLLVFVRVTCMLLHVNIQTGGCGVAEGVIAKSLLQKTV